MMPDAGMTPEKLREIADWFDAYDELAESYLALVGSYELVRDGERLASALVAVRGKEVQTDLRRWADAIARDVKAR